MPEEKRLTVQTKHNPACRQLFYLYKVVLEGMENDAISFIYKSGLFQRNLAMLRDHSGQLFQGRISEQIPDRDAFLDWKRQYAAKLHQVTERYTIGSSAGGYAALMFGHHLAVDEAWAFSPLTLVENDSAKGREGILDEDRDLAQLLSNWNGKTTYHVYYCEDCKPDVIAAERIAQCPGVKLYPRPGNTHIVLNVLDELGELPTLFPPM